VISAFAHWCISDSYSDVTLHSNHPLLWATLLVLACFHIMLSCFILENILETTIYHWTVKSTWWGQTLNFQRCWEIQQQHQEKWKTLAKTCRIINWCMMFFICVIVDIIEHLDLAENIKREETKKGTTSLAPCDLLLVTFYSSLSRNMVDTV
jgi:hypothetical protein